MKATKFTLLIIALLCVTQQKAYSYKAAKDTSFWRETAVLADVKPEDVSYGDATIIQDNRFVNYKSQTREITRHQIVYIKTAEGLDDNNKVIIYVPNSGKISEIKARSISANGEVVELNQNNIKEIEDYSDNGNLKIFAIEGAEVNGQIEYTYTIVTPLYDSGREVLSMNYKILHACVIVRGFSAFKLDALAFNWEFEETKKSQSDFMFVFNDIQPIAEELYATPRANRTFVEHKLKGSDYVNSAVSSYTKMVEYQRNRFFSFSQVDNRKLKGLIKKNFNQELKGEEAIRQMSVYLKRNFFYENTYDDSHEDLQTILKKNVGNDVGLTKLYCAVLSYLEIPYEVHVTTNKYDDRLSEKFCTRYTLDEFIIYFPKYKTYLYPAGQVVHYGLVPSWLAGNNSLVVTSARIGPKFQEIKGAAPELNMTALEFDITMDVANGTSVFDIYAFGTGNLAYSYNSDMYYSDSDEEKRKELEAYISWRHADAEIVSAELINPELWGDIGTCTDYECKREFKAKVKSATFFSKVGNKLLIKVGDLIGPQNELYSELERVQPINNAYNKAYKFTIRIAIPDGYKYAGEENVIIDNSFKNDKGESVAGFKSELTTTDDMVTIDIYEYYAFINIDKEFYDSFRMVVNSAADFNKATLLFEKK